MFLVPALPPPLSSWLYVPGSLLALGALVLAVQRGVRRGLIWLKEQGNAEALTIARRAATQARASQAVAEEAARNWREASEALEKRVDALEGEVRRLNRENIALKRNELTSQRVIRWLRARVKQLEAAFAANGMPVPAPESPEPAP